MSCMERTEKSSRIILLASFLSPPYLLFALAFIALPSASHARSYILEINDTAPGLMFEHEDEDLGYIREVVLQRMNALNGFKSP